MENNGRVKIIGGRTFLHDVFMSHHLPDFSVANETLRNVFSGEVVRFAKTLKKPVLPTPLKITVFFLSRDGFILLLSKKNLFSNCRSLSPVIIYPSYPFGREVITLSDLLKKYLPEELLKGSSMRVFSTHVDLLTLGEVTLSVLVETNKKAVEVKRVFPHKVIPLNVVKLPKFKDFKNKKLTVMRTIAESIESFSETLGVSHEVYPLLNE